MILVAAPLEYQSPRACYLRYLRMVAPVYITLVGNRGGIPEPGKVKMPSVLPWLDTLEANVGLAGCQLARSIRRRQYRRCNGRFGLIFRQHS